jgi:serpin B
MKTKKIFAVLVTILVVSLVCIGCKGQNNNNKAYTVDVNDINTVTAGNSGFAFDLYGKIKGDSNAPKGNLFFSPYSVSTALAMTYGGARGETKEQMAKTLRFTLPDQNLYSAFGNLQKQLIQENKLRGYQLLLANALWCQKGEPFLKDFLDLTQNYYGAGTNQVDFVNETEKSRQEINSWVEEKTNEKIKELIPPDGVERETVLVLTNAIYFKGDWKFKFKRKDTEQADFFISKEDKIKVDMMHIKEKFKYYADEKMQAVELPYKSNETSMLVLLPNETESLKEIEDTLTAESLSNLLSKITTEKIDVYFPKFKMKWGSFSLNNVLKKLGMLDAFDRDKADFSGINGKGGIWISDVFHQAMIEVNEQGTEAAAGTGVVIVKSFHIEPIFRADHPFIFIIKDNRSGSILFMGRVINPTE